MKNNINKNIQKIQKYIDKLKKIMYYTSKITMNKQIKLTSVLVG